jgi:hypothetical protein
VAVNSHNFALAIYIVTILCHVGLFLQGLKKLASTRPHPDTHVSHGKAANIVTGPVLGLIDRARDAFTGRQTTTTAPIS